MKKTDTPETPIKNEKAAAQLAQQRAGRNSVRTTPLTLVQPVRNAVNILRHLAASPQEVSATQIARSLDINASTCFNILRTLVYLEVVDFDGTTKGYKSGLGAVHLANSASLIEQGKGAELFARIEQLAHEYSVTMMIFRRLGEDRLVASHVVDSPAPVRVHVRVGQRFPLLAGSAGRVWAAFGGLDRVQIQAHWPTIRWNHPPMLPDFLRQVERTKKNHWAVDDQEHVAGMVSVSIPLLRLDGSLLSILTAAWPTGHMSKATIRDFTAELEKLTPNTMK